MSEASKERKEVELWLSELGMAESPMRCDRTAEGAATALVDLIRAEIRASSRPREGAHEVDQASPPEAPCACPPDECHDAGGRGCHFGTYGPVLPDRRRVR